METFWDTRYKTSLFVYGKEPNGFFASELDKIAPGALLLPGEGEGRNAIYAALNGWLVDAFDQSRIGSEKALAFAREKGVQIKYRVCSIEEYAFLPKHYDAIGLTFFHVAASKRMLLHSQVIKALKPGGIVILEAFHTSQLGNSSGGPGSLEMLFNEKNIASDFIELETIYMEEKSVSLEEGSSHQGNANVICFVGRKK